LDTALEALKIEWCDLEDFKHKEATGIGNAMKKTMEENILIL
jgi:hypothetical protein